MGTVLGQEGGSGFFWDLSQFSEPPRHDTCMFPDFVQISKDLSHCVGVSFIETIPSFPDF